MIKIKKEIAVKHESSVSTSNLNNVSGKSNSIHKKRKRTLETADSSRLNKVRK